VPIRRAYHILFHSVPLLLHRVSLSTRTTPSFPNAGRPTTPPSIHPHREPPLNLSHQGTLPTQTEHPKPPTLPFVRSGEPDTGPSPRPSHRSTVRRKPYGNPTISRAESDLAVPRTVSPNQKRTLRQRPKECGQVKKELLFAGELLCLHNWIVSKCLP
jgi:hypothetical protein